MTLYVEKVGAGPPLVLLHGWGLNGAVWNTLHDMLAPHFTLHLIDMPGHGFSSHVPVGKLNELADSVVAALPSQFHLAGWSLGGQVALDIAQRHPQRIDKLMLIATTPRFIDTADWPHGKKTVVLDDFAKRLGADYHSTIKSFLALQVLHQPHARKMIGELQESVGARGTPSVGQLNAGLTILRETDLRAQIHEINTPTLIIQGDRDALTSEAAGAWLAQQLPNATYAKIVQATHAPFLSHPAIFKQHVYKFFNL
jgi:pimeloyl-[acyl-carrier protein] methyl ester esterase